jgi:antitoxin FitA
MNGLMAETGGEGKRACTKAICHDCYDFNDCIDCIDIGDCNAIIAIMASITIRNLPEATKQRLRMRAAERGHSMEEEARGLIEKGLAPVSKPQDGGKWVEDMLARMRAIGDAESELVIPDYEAEYEPIDFSKHGTEE